MAVDNGNVMTVVDEDGNEKELEILFTYHSDEYNKDYVVFSSDDEEDEVSAAIYVEHDDESGELLEIEDDAEWEMIEKVLDDYEYDGDDDDE